MTREELKALRAGRPGSGVLVRGDVRTIHKDGRTIEIQFANYSLDIPIRDVVPVRLSVARWFALEDAVRECDLIDSHGADCGALREPARKCNCGHEALVACLAALKSEGA